MMETPRSTMATNTRTLRTIRTAVTLKCAGVCRRNERLSGGAAGTGWAATQSAQVDSTRAGGSSRPHCVQTLIPGVGGVQAVDGNTRRATESFSFGFEHANREHGTGGVADYLVSSGPLQPAREADRLADTEHDESGIALRRHSENALGRRAKLDQVLGRHGELRVTRNQRLQARARLVHDALALGVVLRRLLADVQQEQLRRLSLRKRESVSARLDGMGTEAGTK